MPSFRMRLCAALVVAVSCLLGLARPAGAVSSTVVISQIYGGGGNSTAPYQNDYVELFNKSTSLVDLSGWSIQYTSAAGTGNFGSATNLITPLRSGLLLSPGQYVLVQEASGGATGSPLPGPFETDRHDVPCPSVIHRGEDVFLGQDSVAVETIQEIVWSNAG